jgi:hypothetical protein
MTNDERCFRFHSKEHLFRKIATNISLHEFIRTQFLFRNVYLQAGAFFCLITVLKMRVKSLRGHPVPYLVKAIICFETNKKHRQQNLLSSDACFKDFHGMHSIQQSNIYQKCHYKKSGH